MKSNLQELINSHTPVLIDFYADWCAPCRMMPPILKEVKDNFGEALKVVKIDTEKNPAVSQALSIRSIPTIMLFRNGEMLWRHSGVMDASNLTNTIRQKVAS